MPESEKLLLISNSIIPVLKNWVTKIATVNALFRFDWVEYPIHSMSPKRIILQKKLMNMIM
jgi:hypothetical protein